MALCLTLHRLAFPSRWKDKVQQFGRSSGTLSRIFNSVVIHLAVTFKHLLEWHPRLRSYRRLRSFAKAIKRQSGAGSIWGFVDGTFKPVARPSKNQKSFYSGHKKQHGIGFQGIVTPDGMLSSLIGPYYGKDNDWAMFLRSGVTRRLRRIMNAVPGRRMLYLYGDPAYHNSYGVMAPFDKRNDAVITPEQRAFNARMSSVRISVEHGFGKAYRLWQYTAYKQQQRVGQQPTAAYYIAAVLLANCHTCLEGYNQTSRQFGL